MDRWPERLRLFVFWGGVWFVWCWCWIWEEKVRWGVMLEVGFWCLGVRDERDERREGDE